MKHAASSFLAEVTTVTGQALLGALAFFSVPTIRLMGADY
jgi:hypothetical protein